MANRHIPISHTRVSTTQELPLGRRYERHVPGDEDPQIWRYVKNDEASAAFAVGEVVERKAGATTALGVKGAATTTRASALGVAQHAIAAQSFGFILEKGRGQVLCDGNVTADTDITPDASAEVTDIAAGEEHRVIGVALAADSGASTLVAADINCS